LRFYLTLHALVIADNAIELLPLEAAAIKTRGSADMLVRIVALFCLKMASKDDACGVVAFSLKSALTEHLDRLNAAAK
jgi:hypothetical protein